MMTLDDLKREAHAIAKEKGWWDKGDRPLDEQFANFFGEVSEAWEEYRKLRMETYFDQASGKPEGFYVELADLLIRLADSSEVQGWPMFEFKNFTVKNAGNIPAYICELNECLVALRRDSSKDPSWVVAMCFGFARHHQHDLWATIKLKMEYNRTRPYRHGGKVA